MLPDRRVSASVPEEIFPAFSEVRLAPDPLKVPTKELFALGNELTPLKVLAPEKVWFPLSKGTLAERRASERVPVTSVPRAIRLGVQSVPLKRNTWLAAGAVESTLTPRMRTTVELLEAPVTSPARVTDELVAVTVMFVNPAP